MSSTPARPHRSARPGRCALGVALLLLAACGGNDDDGDKGADGAALIDGAVTDDGAAGGDGAGQPGAAWRSALVAGRDHVGVSVIDITPPLLEPYTDLDGDERFDGCKDDPLASGGACLEPWEDVNGNGRYDGAFIAGFGDARAATGVHDPITARAIAFARPTQDGNVQVAVLVSLDVIGLGNDHIRKATAALTETDGLTADQVIVSSTHTHQGPDVRGMWGKKPAWSGADPVYNAFVRDGIVQAARAALADLQPASLRVGAVALRERSPWFSGSHFGGKNPRAHQHGLLNDIRDPNIVDDLVTALLATGDDGKAVASVVFFSGHPELLGSDNLLLSADYVHYTRVAMEDALGGDCVFVSTALGGMMSALGSQVPLLDDDGAWVLPEGVDAGAVGLQGAATPAWAEKETWDHARSMGFHVAEAAQHALQTAALSEDTTLDPFIVEAADFLVPPENGELVLMYKLGLFDLDPNDQITDPAACPEYDPKDDIGCLPERVWHWRLGALDALTAPGELLPELFWGLPTDDPRWNEESADPSRRGAARGSAYFRYHPESCDGADWSVCQAKTSVQVALDDGGTVTCECPQMHAVPYEVFPPSAGADAKAPAELLEGRFKVLVGNGGDHLGYIIQESDFYRLSSQLAGGNGDHYEESVSVSPQMSTRWDETLRALLQ